MNTARICPICRVEIPLESDLSLCPRCYNGELLAGGQAAQAPVRRFVPPHPAALQVLFPQLEILGLLGAGGMGAVYRARQRGLDRFVALKILPPAFSSDPAFAERFAREARTLARLNHPNIVDVYDLGQAGPLYYFLMEYVDGVSLRHLLNSRRFTPEEAMSILPQICEGLAYAHDKGVVHRDIKPENILLDQKGCIKIADFGVSKLLGDEAASPQLTQTDHVLGTMHYMAPEQYQNPVTTDHRADVYSVGVVFYEMLTGSLPRGRFELASRVSGGDPRLDELILRALEPDPKKRFQNTREFCIQMEAVSGVPTKLTPEVRRKLSFEYRSKITILGLPLVHVATGVDPATGRKRTAKGILAFGNAPRGVIAFGDVAVGVIACGIFGYGLITVSVVGVGVLAFGSVAVGLVFAAGGLAMAPVAMGGAALGYFATGAIAWGLHSISPGVSDPVAEQFFNARAVRFSNWLMRGSIVAVPVFLALGLLPNLMAWLAERRRRKRLKPQRRSPAKGAC